MTGPLVDPAGRHAVVAGAAQTVTQIRDAGGPQRRRHDR